MQSMGSAGTAGVRALFGSVVLAWAALAAPAAWAQAGYPSKPVLLIVPLAAGSAVDNAARVLVQKMGESMGQTFVVENMAGSAGLVGADRVARAAPDGYTLGGYNDSILTMVPHMMARMPWNALTDFDPVSLVGTIEWGLVVRADSPYKTVADFVAAGEVDIAMQGLGTVVSLIQAGRLRLLAVGTTARLPQYPSVPTFTEAGVPGFTFNSWFAMVAPAGTPKDIVARLNAEITKALTDPATRDKLVAMGLTPRGTSAAEFGQATKVQYELYRKLIAEQNIKAD